MSNFLKKLILEIKICLTKNVVIFLQFNARAFMNVDIKHKIKGCRHICLCDYFTFNNIHSI